MEKLLTGDIWSEVNKLFTKGQKKTACIAYVTSDKLELSEGDILVCDASDYAIKFGETSAETLNTYFLKGVKLYSNSELHSKILLTDKFLVVGSANLSKNSAERLTESSIVTDNDILLSQAKSFCYNLTQESTVLTSDKIDELLKIEVVKRPFKPTTKFKIREKSFGNKYWFISVSPLSVRAYNKIKEDVEETKILLAERENVEQEHISFLRLSAKTVFGKTAKEGDQIVLRFNNEGNTRSYVYSPSTILERKTKDGFIYFYHDSYNSEKNKISWTKFQAFIKTIKLDKSISGRTKSISEVDVSKLKPVWT